MVRIPAALLVKRLESALLVNVDNGAFQRQMNSPEAIAALKKIQKFPNLSSDAKTVINKLGNVKKAKKGANIRLNTKNWDACCRLNQPFVKLSVLQFILFLFLCVMNCLI